MSSSDAERSIQQDAPSSRRRPRKSNGDSVAATPQTENGGSAVAAKTKQEASGAPAPAEDREVGRDSAGPGPDANEDQEIAPQEPWLAGTVLYFVDGEWQLMAGVPVVLSYNDDSLVTQTQTDEEGRYIFPDLIWERQYSVSIPEIWAGDSDRGRWWLLETEDTLSARIDFPETSMPSFLFLPAEVADALMVRARIELQSLLSPVFDGMSQKPELNLEGLTNAVTVGLVGIAESIRIGLAALAPIPPTPPDITATEKAINDALHSWHQALQVLAEVEQVVASAPDFAAEIEELRRAIAVERFWLENQRGVLDTSPSQASEIRAEVERRRSNLKRRALLMLRGLEIRAEAKVAPAPVGPEPNVDWITVESKLEDAVASLEEIAAIPALARVSNDEVF